MSYILVFVGGVLFGVSCRLDAYSKLRRELKRVVSSTKYRNNNYIAIPIDDWHKVCSAFCGYEAKYENMLGREIHLP